MKTLKLVDSLNKKSQIRHIKALNWYTEELKKKLDKRLEKRYNCITIIITRNINKNG